MPGEFEPHAGCWMLWPERPDFWREGAAPAQKEFAAVAQAIAMFEPVTVGAASAQYARARSILPPEVRLVEIQSNDAWMRDVGPSFVANDAGALRGVDWGFNAWGGFKGGLYAPWDADEQVAQKVLEIERADRYAAPLILEGGSIHVDGQGTLITTEECLLNENRNPSLSRVQIERHLRNYLNAETIIWLGLGVPYDETDGHVDNLCAFAKPGHVTLTWTDDKADPLYEICRDAEVRLMTTKDARGRRLAVHRLPQPGPLFMTKAEAKGLEDGPLRTRPLGGERLPASYANYYIANGGVVMPLLDEKTDRKAAMVLRALFPGRKIIGIPAREILLGGGNIHCITQQQPLARKRPRRTQKHKKG